MFKQQERINKNKLLEYVIATKITTTVNSKKVWKGNGVIPIQQRKSVQCRLKNIKAAVRMNKRKDESCQQ